MESILDTLNHDESKNAEGCHDADHPSKEGKHLSDEEEIPGIPLAGGAVPTKIPENLTSDVDEEEETV